MTAGVRYSLYSPPYETNGLQVAPSVSMGQWFDQRAQNAVNGIPSTASEIVTFDLAGPKNDRPGFYAWDKNNFAPRLAVAWTPAERLVIRGGYSKVFDRVGVGLATNFDEGFAFGMSTQISSPFGARLRNQSRRALRNITTMPSTMPAAPKGGFPQTPPIRAGMITSSIDDTLVTPSAHMTSATIGYDFGRNFSIEAGYIGRFGRDLLVRRDLAMPLNLVDPASRTDYFTAAQNIIRAAQAAGITGSSPAGAYAGLPAMAYWENIFPARAGGGLTATQAITRAFMQNGPDWITALYDMDTACSPACSKFGPYSYFAEQYDSLAAISSIGRSNYNGMNVTLRRRFADGVQFDINYTLAKSEDMGSQVERGSDFSNYSNGGNSGFLINSFDPELNYGRSDFDIRHQVNTNWLAEMPFGQGKRYGADAGGVRQPDHRRLVGRGLAALDQRVPLQRRQLPLVLGDQLEPAGQRDARRSERCRRPRTTKNAVDGRPARSSIPTGGARLFRRQFPGESAFATSPRRWLLHHRPEPEQGVVGSGSPTTACDSAGTYSTSPTRRSSTSAS